MNDSESPPLWHESDLFWRAVRERLFTEERCEKAAQEIDGLVSLLHLEPGMRVLDLCCGIGRHSMELARRGFHVTAVDRSEDYLAEARENARRNGLSIDFVCADMRELVRPLEFDAAISWFTSFGYFDSEEDEERVLRNVSASLLEDGRFALDLAGREVVQRDFRARDWQRIGEAYWLEERRIVDDWTYIETTWIRIHESSHEHFRFRLRLYSAPELTELLERCGFQQTRVYGDLRGAPYDHKAQRLIVAAQKKPSHRRR